MLYNTKGTLPQRHSWKMFFFILKFFQVSAQITAVNNNPYGTAEMRATSSLYVQQIS